MKKLLTLLCLTIVVELVAQTALPTAWNFSNPGITLPPNGWTLMNTLPASTGGQTYAFGTGDNLSCRFDAAGEYLIINFADKPGPMTYYVSPQNAGNPWSGQFDVQQSADGSSWSTLKSFTYAATTATNFTNGKNTETGLLSTTRFVRFIFTTKTAGNFALDSVLILPAPPPLTPSINIKQAGSNVVMGSTFVVGKTASTSFTIENKGVSQTLNITGISFSGQDSADYTASNVPASVNALSTATFTLNFTPSQNGTRKTVMHIRSNDPDKSDYDIDLYGIGGNYASEPTQPPTAMSINNIKACGMEVTFNAPAQHPEKYIVLRKKSGSITDVPVDGVTYKVGDYIGSSQVAYIGDSVTTLKPTYIFANSDYSFKAFSFNGPAGFQNYLTTSAASSSTTTPGKNIGTYYSGITSANNNFITQLTSKINPHDTVFYSQYISRFVNPFITRDTSGGKKIVNCVYTTLPYVYNEPFLWWNGSNGATLTREHTYAQSWMPSRSAPNWPNAANGKEFPEYNDLHHLFPADQANGNGTRSNYPFGEVVSNAQPSPTGIGILGKDANGATVWEPRNEHKGDVARALFYMCTAYNGINGLNWSLPSSQNQEVLKKWHFQDLPDNWEIARHEFVFSQQHNRNPFIDSVNYVCHINFSNMSYIANPGVCGVSNPMLQITKPIGGEVYAYPSTVDTIKWISSDMDTLVVALYVSDTLYQTLGTVKASNALLKWDMPNALSSNKCKIKLSDPVSGIVSMSPAYFTIAGMDGINELLNSNQILVFPNPSTGIVHLNCAANILIQKVMVRDITGRLIKEHTTVAQSNADIEITQQGIYLIEVKTSKGNVMKKIVIE